MTFWLRVVEAQNVLDLEKHARTIVTGNKNISKECWEKTAGITWEAGLKVLTVHKPSGIIPAYISRWEFGCRTFHQAGALVGLQEMGLSVYPYVSPRDGDYNTDMIDGERPSLYGPFERNMIS